MNPKLKIYLLTILAFLSHVSAFAQSGCDEEAPPAPPGAGSPNCLDPAPIDTFQVVLIILAVGLVFFYFKQQQRNIKA